ncbi:MAG: penicillin-binding transpeptidase domain-containing protein, partial [Bacteroidota bacterium]|nr:penicillin-binding transpeptidase domain-containing protein [Bacteroidota bacterium]
HEDSLEWESNPLYGWCNKNLRPDGTPHNLYTDGLKIYTTIDSRMQKYAEEAVVHHLKDYFQPEFDKRMRTFKNPPFANNLSDQEIKDILDRAMKQSERYRVSRLAGKSDREIRDEFNTRIPMTVFTWHGDKNVVMSPMDSIKYYLGYLRSSMMVMEPQTGYVKAYVGGPDFKHFMYDMVKTGKRQVGSTVKPFLYTLAMQNGFTPCTMVPNAPVSFQLSDGSTWTAKNAGRTGKEGQMVSLKWGLANSVNQISAWIMKQFNPENVVTVMQKMGVYSPIDPVPSIFLGTSDISLYEMVGAYGTFVNKGVYSKPIFVTRIEDKNGNAISQFKSDQQEAIDEQTAFLMVNLLRGVVDQGTAKRLRWNADYGGFKAEMAGKTGTTQNQSDGWFMGILPRLVAGVWTGADIRSIHFEDSAGQGNNAALPVFGYFMKKVYADPGLGYSQSEKFVMPQNFNVNLNCGGEGASPQQQQPQQQQQSKSQDDQFF